MDAFCHRYTHNNGFKTKLIIFCSSENIGSSLILVATLLIWRQYAFTKYFGRQWTVVIHSKAKYVARLYSTMHNAIFCFHGKYFFSLVFSLIIHPVLTLWCQHPVTTSLHSSIKPAMKTCQHVAFGAFHEHNKPGIEICHFCVAIQCQNLENKSSI